jgi:uncharacterized membrane protein required for colicin V production
MDWIILIGITLLSAFSGYRKGALQMTLRLISFVAGYVVAWKLTPALAQWLIDTHKLQGVIVYPVAGLSLFLGAGILLNLVCSLLLWLIPAHIKEGGKSVGALLGGLCGLLFAFLCVWTIGIAQHAWIQRQQASHPGANPIRPTSSAARALSGKMISSAAHVIIGDENPMATVTNQMLSDPVAMSQGLNYLSRQPDVRELFADANNYRAMVNGTPESIMQLPSFQNLISDPQAMAFLSRAGLTGNSPAEQQRTLAGNLSTYAKNIELIKNTPEYRNIITDPEVTTRLKEHDYMALFTNEKVRLLAEMLTHGPSAVTAIPSTTAQTTTINSVTTDTEEKKDAYSNKGIKQKIYRWVDKNGGVHYSEQPPTPAEARGEVIEMTH